MAFYELKNISMFLRLNKFLNIIVLYCLVINKLYLLFLYFKLFYTLHIEKWEIIKIIVFIEHTFHNNIHTMLCLLTCKILNTLYKKKTAKVMILKA